MAHNEPGRWGECARLARISSLIALSIRDYLDYRVLVGRYGRVAVEILVPLGRGGKPSNIPGGIFWLNLVVLVERADCYSAAVRTPDFEGGGRSGGSLSPSNTEASWV